MNNNTLPLRTGVGIVVLNSNNKVFVGKRKDNPIDKWQMPQGGVDPNEELLSAMKRELFEETSIKSIKLLKKLDYWLEYELPKSLLGIVWKGKYKHLRENKNALAQGDVFAHFLCSFFTALAQNINNNIGYD